MKQIVGVLKAVLMIAVLASLAACSGGAFSDPGHEASGLTDGSGGGVESGGKPEKLSNDASYDEAVAKLDEIIDYCDDHPGPGNDSAKASVEQVRQQLAMMGASAWDGSLISSINAYISLLQ
jgi:ABC-type glycerol-3-phosphate transport system substrate-binding protein